MAGTWTCSEQGHFGSLGDNKVIVTGGIEAAPATFADFVTEDRAGTATLLAATNCAKDMTLTYQIRPVELRALQISFVIASKTAQTDYIWATGTDAWGTALSEAIDISAGNGTYVSTQYFATITDIDVEDVGDGSGTAAADGTVAVTQDQWGFIWDHGQNMYMIDSAFDIGDGSTSTYFWDTKKLVLFNDGVVVETKANSTWHMGTEGSDNKSGYDGGVLAWKNDADVDTANVTWAGKTLFYGVKICDLGVQTSDATPPGPFKNIYIFLTGADSEFYNVVCENIDRIRVQNNCNFYGFRAYGCHQPFNIRDNTGTPTFDNIEIRDSQSAGVSTYDTTAISVYNLVAFDSGLSDAKPDIAFQSHQANRGIKMVDATYGSIGDEGTDHPFWSGINEIAFTVNIHVVDEAGADLASVTVLCEDQASAQAFSVSTDGSGDIAEQELVIRDFSGYQSRDVTYTPHVFTFSKAGYQTLVIPAVVTAVPIVWEIELQSQKAPKSARRHND